MAENYSLEWMLWQITDAKTQTPQLATIIEAIAYYTNKYGVVPNRCEVPSDWDNKLAAPEGILVTSSSNLPAHHLRLTVDPNLNANSHLPFKRRF
jgi:hypothetical protein